jgi:hypothetical protein
MEGYNMAKELRKAILMNKNTPVIEFDGAFTEETKILPRIFFNSCKFINKELAPVCVFSDDERIRVGQLQNWFDRRFLNKGRVPEVMGKSGSLTKVRKDIHFANLTDQYWVQYHKDEKWEDINFFTNAFNQEPSSLFEIFVTTNSKYLKDVSLDWQTPDLCTNGVMLKRWVNTSEGIVLEKFSDNRKALFREVLATKILTTMKRKNFVHYELGVSDYQLCSRCLNFVTEDLELVPAWHILDATAAKAKSNMSNYQKLMNAADILNIPNVEEFIDDMIRIDCILCNYDRNQGNFAFFRDVNTGKYIGPAPLYDFGAAFSFTSDNKGTYFKDREIFLYKQNKVLSVNIKAYEDFILGNNILTDKEKASIINSVSDKQKTIKHNLKKYREMDEKNLYF